MKREAFREVISVIQQNLRNGQRRKCIATLRNHFPGFSEDAFVSIYSQHFQRELKRKFAKHHKAHTMMSYYKRFLNDAASKIDGSILAVSDEIDFPPVMTARIILEQHTLRELMPDRDTVPKGFITRLLRDVSQINDDYLAGEVTKCIQADENCGPETDALKTKAGADCENRLAAILKDRDIPYLDEDELRNLGYDKTPDVRLCIPIAVDGYVINWIESKASFGDPESHQGYLTSQFWSYCNRFGPGMVIYWFGFVDDLDSNRNRGIMLADGFPHDIVTLDSLL